MNCNLAIKKDGTIRAITGVFPVKTYAAGDILKTAIIGGVSVHPDDRGKGYMRMLMSEAGKSIKKSGYHFSCLGGARNRYKHFGYEKAGTLVCFALNKKDMLHCDKYKEGAKEITFRPIEEADEVLLEKVSRLYDSQPFHVKRPYIERYRYLTTWNSTPQAAFDQYNNMIGYLCARKNNSWIGEAIAGSAEYFGSMIYKWVEKQEDNNVTLTLPAWDFGQIRAAGILSESVSIRAAYNFEIIDWTAVLEPLFKIKSSITPMRDGKLIIGVLGYGNIFIEAEDGCIKCSITEEKAELMLGWSEATRLFFGPLPPVYICDSLPEGWFPLPLSWLPLDGA
jgi:hypothetical protein